MEWGTFLQAIVALYLVYYGLNFLYDMFINGGKAKTVQSNAIQYSLGDVMGEEEQAHVVNEKDFDEPLVEIIPTAIDEAEPSQESVQYWANEDSQEEEAEEELLYYQEDEEEPYTEDEEEEEPLPVREEAIEIPVQGQPISVMDALKLFKMEAQQQAQVVFS